MVGKRWLGGLKGTGLILGGLQVGGTLGGGGVAWGQEELFVANVLNNSVTVYARTASGDMAPLRTLQGPHTGLSNPTGVAVDTVHGELIVANSTLTATTVGPGTITVYPRTWTGTGPGNVGDVAPLRTLQGFSTEAFGLAVDTVHDELIVTDGRLVFVFRRTASGDALRDGNTLRILQPALLPVRGVAVDIVHDELVLTVPFSVLVYPRTWTGTGPLHLTTMAPVASGSWAARV